MQVYRRLIDLHQLFPGACGYNISAGRPAMVYTYIWDHGGYHVFLFQFNTCHILVGYRLFCPVFILQGRWTGAKVWPNTGNLGRRARGILPGHGFSG